MSLTALPWKPHAAWFARTYGVSEGLFREFGFWASAGDPRVWMVTAHTGHPATPEDLANLGWPVLDGPLPDGGATAAALRIIGADATQNVIDLTAEQAATLRAGGAIEVAPGHDASLLIARLGKLVLGGVRPATGRLEAGDPAP